MHISSVTAFQQCAYHRAFRARRRRSRILPLGRRFTYGLMPSAVPCKRNHAPKTATFYRGPHRLGSPNCKPLIIFMFSMYVAYFHRIIKLFMSSFLMKRCKTCTGYRIAKPQQALPVHGQFLPPDGPIWGRFEVSFLPLIPALQIASAAGNNSLWRATNNARRAPAALGAPQALRPIDHGCFRTVPRGQLSDVRLEFVLALACTM